MSKFDFGQFFNENNGGQSQQPKGPQDPASLVQELLKAATQSYQAKTEVSQEEALEIFNKKYGSPEKFIMEHFQKLTEPYEEAMLKGLSEKLQTDNARNYAPIMIAAALENARHFNSKMVQDHAGDQGEEIVTMKTAMLATAISRSIPDHTPLDTMIAVHALMSIASLKMAELTVQIKAGEAVQEHISRGL